MHECSQCGLTPGDLPPGTPPGLIFETCEHCSRMFCQSCLFEHEFGVAS